MFPTAAWQAADPRSTPGRLVFYRPHVLVARSPVRVFLTCRSRRPGPLGPSSPSRPDTRAQGASVRCQAQTPSPLGSMTTRTGREGRISPAREVATRRRVTVDPFSRVLACRRPRFGRGRRLSGLRRHGSTGPRRGGIQAAPWPRAHLSLRFLDAGVRIPGRRRPGGSAATPPMIRHGVATPGIASRPFG